MIINKADSTNFKAIYRLPYSQRALNEIKEQVIPTYKIVTHRECVLFEGKNPLFSALKSFMDIIADMNNSSVEWLKMNAKNHGINEKDMEENFIHVITGKKDNDAITDFMVERNNEIYEILKDKIKQKTSVLHKIKTVFVPDKMPDLGFNENTPQHLKPLFYLINQDKQNTKLFNEKFSKPIEVKSAKELFIKMMNER